MQKLQFYRANKNKTGVAVSFNFGLNAKKTAIDLYASGVKQVGWDDTKKVGSFYTEDVTKKLNMKFSEFEVGGIINALEGKGPFSAYHKSDAGSTTASVRPYVPEKIKQGSDWVENTKKVATGYSITLKKGDENGISFPLVVTYGEATTLAIYLRAGLTEKFLTDLAPANTGGNTRSNYNKPAASKQEAPAESGDSSEPVEESTTTNDGGDEDVPF